MMNGLTHNVIVNFIFVILVSTKSWLTIGHTNREQKLCTGSKVTTTSFLKLMKVSETVINGFEALIVLL